jgi:predicted esterase
MRLLSEMMIVAMMSCAACGGSSPLVGGGTEQDAGLEKDGGAPNAGGPERDGGGAQDGGAQDGGAQDGGARDGGANNGGTGTLAPMRPYSAGACPSLRAGTVPFRSFNRDRTFLLFVPAPRSERPGLLFLWHGLGDSARNFASAFNAQDAAEQHNLVIVVPTPILPSIGGLPIWGFSSDHDVDETLFDDVRTCAADKLAIDPRRVYTMGFSAGGLWSTHLVIHRSDALAAAVIFSGGASMDGTFSPRYEAPRYTTPVLLTHGGSTDVFGGFVFFQQLVEYLASHLVADGHYVLPCYHSRGHRLPTGATAWSFDFLVAHTFSPGRSGQSVSPYADPSTPRASFPSLCTFP